MTSRTTRGRRSIPLAARFLVAFIAVAVLPLMAVGAFQITSSYTVQLAQVEQLQQEAARAAANTIDAYLSQIEDQMTLTAREWSLRAEDARPALLDGLLAYNAGFETLTMMDVTGQETVKTSRYTLFGPQDLVSRAETPEFLVPMFGERYLGPISVSQYGEPLAILAIPIKNVVGQITGVLSAEVNLKYMWDLIGRMEIGRGGYAYVVDNEGRLIAHRDSSLVLQGRELSDLAGVRNALAGQDITVSYAGLSGQNVIGRYQPLGLAPWFVFVETSTREAMAGVFRAALTGVIAITIALVVAALLGWYTTRSVVQPMRRLQEGAASIGSGDLSHRIDVQARDELGAVARAFNAMAEQLQEVFATLEQRVADRTHDLEQRAIRLATAADVGRAASSILELETLSRQVVELIRERFDLYYAALFLLDEEGRFAVLEAGTGEPGSTMKLHGHRLEIGGMSMVGAACAQGQVRIALDVGEEPVRFDNPLLPDTRSEMALPLMVGDRVLGALDVQSSRPAAFSEEDIAVLQLVADQVAVAVDNARKFSEEAALLEATSPIFRASLRTTRAGTTSEVIQATTTSIAETEADGCAIALFDFDPQGKAETFTFLGRWDRRGDSMIPIGVPFPVRETGFPHQMVTTPWTIDDIAKRTQIPEKARQFLARFNSQALVNLPLKAGERVIGFVIVHRAVVGPFSQVVMRFYSTLAGLTAVALERTRLLEEAQNRATHEQVTRQAMDRIRSAVSVEDAIQRAVGEMSRVLGASEVVARIGTEGELLPKSGGDGHE